MIWGRSARRWLMTAIVAELVAAGLVGALAWTWPLEDFSKSEIPTQSPATSVTTTTFEDALPALPVAIESAKKSIHRPLYDRPPAPVIVAEAPKPVRKPRPAVKLIGTIADPSGNRGIFETAPQQTEVKQAGERFEQLPAVLVKQIDPDKAVLELESEEFEVTILAPPVEGRTQ
jgi:hypothetical protein